MNENQTITIIVSTKGDTKIETNGFTGASCRDASKFLESTLGSQTAEKLKSEYFTDTFNTTGEQEKNQC